VKLRNLNANVVSRNTVLQCKIQMAAAPTHRVAWAEEELVPRRFTEVSEAKKEKQKCPVQVSNL
jgi:hypothetical protein